MRWQIVMRVTLDKWRSLVANVGNMVCMLKTTFNTDLCYYKQPLQMIIAI